MQMSVSILRRLTRERPHVSQKPIAYWDDVAREHFAPNAQMKLTLWKCDGSPGQTLEAKPYG